MQTRRRRREARCANATLGAFRGRSAGLVGSGHDMIVYIGKHKVSYTPS